MMTERVHLVYVSGGNDTTALCIFGNRRKSWILVTFSFGTSNCAFDAPGEFPPPAVS